MLGGQSLAKLKSFGASIVDTAICAKPDGVLAGQLLYGDSIDRSYFVLILSGSNVSAVCSMQSVLPKNLPRFPLPAERV